MALETLKGVDEIGGFQVRHHYLDPHEVMAKTYVGDYIIVDHSDNSIKFEIQNGPIKENGVNGCQVDTLIETAKIMIEGLNKKYPCIENDIACVQLKIALEALKDRKKNREKRGVEGYDEK